MLTLHKLGRALCLGASFSFRILVVDDHPIVCSGVWSLLGREEGFEICEEAADVRDAIAKARELKPDGLQITREITGAFPEIRIVVLSQHGAPKICTRH